MLHPSTKVQFIDPTIGHGVFATSNIPMGTILWVRDELDQEISTERLANMNVAVRETMLTYSYRNNKGNYIFCWDNTKYINHSSNANCMTTPYGFEIAIRDIIKGDEITNDYGTLNIIEPFEPCDENEGRKVIYPNDISTFHKKWDDIINQAINSINSIDQPLQKYFAENHWQEIQNIINGTKLPTSILTCLYIQKDEG